MSTQRTVPFPPAGGVWAGNVRLTSAKEGPTPGPAREREVRNS